VFNHAIFGSEALPSTDVPILNNKTKWFVKIQCDTMQSVLCKNKEMESKKKNSWDYDLCM